MNPGIVICTRSDSARIIEKPWQMIAGKYLIQRLLENIANLMPICLAVPEKDETTYKSRLHNEFNLKYHSGYEDNPLRRMYWAAKENGFDPIIRITHDKIFIDTFCLKEALKRFETEKPDYLYSSKLATGSGFEIISMAALREAYYKFRDRKIEHISYAIRDVTKNVIDFQPPGGHYPMFLSGHRFLLDFEEDLEFVRALYSYSGAKKLDLSKALDTLEACPFLANINRLPKITFYICAYNEQDYLRSCIESILSQDCFYRSELIIIDDCSSDETHEIALEYLNKGRVKVLRNEINMGLSSSSNRAINLARGEYIMRVDADDMLLGSRIASDLMYSSIYHGNDVVYPMHYDQRTKEITQGDLNHHVGGALFSSKALRAVQFTEGLRTYEGLDLFERAKNSLKIGYFDAYPAFFYRDKPGSLSSPNPFREGIKKKIDQGLTGEKLLA